MSDWFGLRRDFYEGDVYPDQLFAFGHIVSAGRAAPLERYVMIRIRTGFYETLPRLDVDRAHHVMHEGVLLLFVAWSVMPGYRWVRHHCGLFWDRI